MWAVVINKLFVFVQIKSFFLSNLLLQIESDFSTFFKYLKDWQNEAGAGYLDEFQFRNPWRSINWEFVDVVNALPSLRENND